MEKHPVLLNFERYLRCKFVSEATQTPYLLVINYLKLQYEFHSYIPYGYTASRICATPAQDATCISWLPVYSRNETGESAMNRLTFLF
jgi:hypothetical protein